MDPDIISYISRQYLSTSFFIIYLFIFYLVELKKIKKVSILLKQISTKHKTLKKVSEIENKLR